MIDAHCHLQDDKFGDGIEQIIEAARRGGVRSFVVNGTREQDWQVVADLADRYPEVIPSFGLHPWYVDGRSADWMEKLRAFLDRFPQAGVGEVGLDRWIRNHDISVQLPIFEQQWHLAVEMDRPLSVHCLKAWGHLDTCLYQLPKHRFLLHSYSGSAEMIPGFVSLGAYFSISGYFLKPEKRAKFAVCDQVPMERLLLETDAPAMELPEEIDLYPESEFNHPANLSIVYREVAARKSMSQNELVSQIDKNFESWFMGQEQILQSGD